MNIGFRSDDEREGAAKWLRTRVPDASAERLVIYPGNQAILFNALMSLIVLQCTDRFALREQISSPGSARSTARLPRKEHFPHLGEMVA